MDATKPARRSLATKPARLSTSGPVSPRAEDGGDSYTTTSSCEAEEKAAAARSSPTYKPKRRVKRRTDAPSALPPPPTAASPADDPAQFKDALVEFLQHMMKHDIPLYLMEQSRFFKPPAAIPFPINEVHTKPNSTLWLGPVRADRLALFEGTTNPRSFWPKSIPLCNVPYDSHTRVQATSGGWGSAEVTLFINRKVWLANAANVMRHDAADGRPVVDWVARVSKALPDHEFVIPPVSSA